MPNVDTFAQQAWSNQNQNWVALMARPGGSGQTVGGHALLAIHVARQGAWHLHVFHFMGMPNGVGSAWNVAACIYGPRARVERYYSNGAGRCISTTRTASRLDLSSWISFMAHNRILSTQIFVTSRNNVNTLIFLCKRAMMANHAPTFSLIGGQLGVFDNCCSWALRMLRQININPDAHLYRWSFLSPYLAVQWGNLQ